MTWDGARARGGRGGPTRGCVSAGRSALAWPAGWVCVGRGEVSVTTTDEGKEGTRQAGGSRGLRLGPLGLFSGTSRWTSRLSLCHGMG